MPNEINIGDFLPGNDQKSSKLIDSKKEEMSSGKIHIIDELKKWIRPLTDSERNTLEESIKNEGVRDPLTFFYLDNGQKVLLDGHNRYEICQSLGGEENGYEFEEVIVDINNIDDAKLWMIKNQVGKRNLSKREMSYYRGHHYLTHKGKQGEKTGDGKLYNLLAEEYNVGKNTILRDAKTAEVLDQVSDTFKHSYFDGEVNVSQAKFEEALKAIKEGLIETEELEDFLQNKLAKPVEAPQNMTSRAAANTPKPFTFNKINKTIRTLIDAPVDKELGKVEKLAMEESVKELIQKFGLDL
ncbi:ParB N-terminal domain-containing protein [Flammeovirga sp. OC4]|uniref:ParB N-terminal domain-containing protein n=1 Tax=Flammeovirga sp. OC4 TaxID=1382345 RepID=UPI0005C454D6|nr:ParB N-terminal domain-containing protein [Flammeovirga sp. OC4]